MPFVFRELNDRVRKLMATEIQNAIEVDTLYYSKRFNETGKEAWPGLLMQAANAHDEHWLAWQLENLVAMKDFETREKPKGGYTTAHVPHTASETLADGEFNRYYMCAICRKAIQDGKKAVMVYRAKQVAKPRAESELLIGTTYDPAELILELRQKPSGSASHELAKPNSGLSIHL